MKKLTISILTLTLSCLTGFATNSNEESPLGGRLSHEEVIQVTQISKSLATDGASWANYSREDIALMFEAKKKFTEAVILMVQNEKQPIEKIQEFLEQTLKPSDLQKELISAITYSLVVDALQRSAEALSKDDRIVAFAEEQMQKDEL